MAEIHIQALPKVKNPLEEALAVGTEEVKNSTICLQKLTDCVTLLVATVGNLSAKVETLDSTIMSLDNVLQTLITTANKLESAIQTHKAVINESIIAMEKNI